MALHWRPGVSPAQQAALTAAEQAERARLPADVWHAQYQNCYGHPDRITSATPALRAYCLARWESKPKSGLGGLGSLLGPAIGFLEGGSSGALGAAGGSLESSGLVPSGGLQSLPIAGALIPGAAPFLSGAAGLAGSLGFASGTGSSTMNLDDILSTQGSDQLPDWLRTVEQIGGSIFGSQGQQGPENPPPTAQAMTSSMGWIVPVAIVGVIVAVALSARR